MIGAILLLPIDNYPLGQSLLREFGTRPTNFFLIGFALTLFSRAKHKKFSSDAKLLAIFSVIAIGIPFGSFFISGTPNARVVLGRSPEAQWALQSAMYIWMIISIWIWAQIWIKFKDCALFWNAIAASAWIQIYFFVADICRWAFGGALNIDTNERIQQSLGGLHDIFRPAGLASEPSLYASWVLLLWPLILYRGSIVHNKFLHATALMLVITGIGSTSRTFLVVLAIQLPLIMLYLYRTPTKKSVALGVLCLPIVAFGVWSYGQSNLSKIASAFNAKQSLSTLARKSGQEASEIITQRYPITGIGLGQFSAHYSSAVPPEYFASHEVREWASNKTESRVSTFSTLKRVQVEYGLVVSLLLALIAIVMIARWISANKLSAEHTLLLTSILGGLSFLLQQDQFGYQPGIFAGAIFTSGIVDKWRVFSK